MLALPSLIHSEVTVQQTLANLEWPGADERLKDLFHGLGNDTFPGRNRLVFDARPYPNQLHKPSHVFISAHMFLLTTVI